MVAKEGNASVNSFVCWGQQLICKTYMNRCVSVYVYMYECMYVCMYVCVCVCVCGGEEGCVSDDV